MAEILFVASLVFADLGLDIISSVADFLGLPNTYAVTVAAFVLPLVAIPALAVWGFRRAGRLSAPWLAFCVRALVVLASLCMVVPILSAAVLIIVCGDRGCGVM